MRDVALRQYTIYDRPADAPGGFVVREWLIVPGEPGPVPGQMVGVAPSLVKARMLVPGWAGACVPRQAGDDPAIVETWI